MATLPLPAGTADVYAIAERWNPSHTLVSWLDNGRQPRRAWIPAGNARRVSDSKCDFVHFDVDGDDFYVDLLFFHIEQSRYVVIEL